MPRKFRLPPIPLGGTTLEALLFLLVFGTCAFFFGELEYNQTSRLMPVYSLVEPGTRDTGTFRIDHFLSAKQPAQSWWLRTADWSVNEGRYYSNKAPGTSFLAAPLYALIFWSEHTLAPSLPERLRQSNVYWLNLWVSVFWTAIGAVYLLRLLREVRGLKEDRALPIVLAYALGTLVFPFSTTVWGHPTAAAFLILAYYHLLRKSPRPVLAGLWLAAAITTEYSCLVAAPPALAFLWYLPDRRRDGAWLALALVLGLAPLLVYQKACFGGWLTLAPMKNNPAFVQEGLWLGVLGGTNVDVLWRLLFSGGRGIFVYMPVLLLCAWGTRECWDEERWGLLAICAFVIAGFLLFNARFNGWHGGASSGPRYLIPSLPFWALLLPDFSRARFRQRWLAAVLGGLSALNMVVIAAVTTMSKAPPDSAVLYGELYRMFLSARYLSTNLPYAMSGRDGVWTNLPLFLFWGAIAYAYRRTLASRRPRSAAATTGRQREMPRVASRRR